MSEPYSVAMIARLLRIMPAARLCAVKPTDFQTWPASRIVPATIIRELIVNEQASRRRQV